jgi:hypothetical protein
MRERMMARKGKKKSRKGMTLMEVVEHIMQTESMSEDEAKKELVRRLRAGEMSATGIPVQDPKS